MKRNAFSVVELITVIGILGVILSVFLFPIIKNHIIGNKQLIDFNYNYNIAYILSDSNKFERIQIKAWKDWSDSDAVQVIKLDGTPIYTHLRNVKLTKE